MSLTSDHHKAEYKQIFAYKKFSLTTFPDMFLTKTNKKKPHTIEL